MRVIDCLTLMVRLGAQLEQSSPLADRQSIALLFLSSLTQEQSTALALQTSRVVLCYFRPHSRKSYLADGQLTCWVSQAPRQPTDNT